MLQKPVTAHTASPWGASIADFFNNDNWTRQYEGTNPRTGEPISVGNWYTPGGASAAPVTTQPVEQATYPNRKPGQTDFRFIKGANYPHIDEDYDLDYRPTLDATVETGLTPDPITEEKPPWWNQVGEFLGTTWEGAKNLPDYLPKISKPITSTLPPETRATEALNYQYLPPSTQQLLFMQDAGIGRKGPVDRRELGLRRNDLSRLMRYGGMDPGDWGG